MDRQPIVAGQFYTGAAGKLREEVKAFLAKAEPPSGPTLLAMAPHAGYMYSGGVAGLTLGRAELADTILLLGPNHTGLGRRLALWDSGAWLFPGGKVDVDAPFADALAERIPEISRDTQAHEREHSLEVLVPFLFCMNPKVRIAPIAISEPKLENLIALGKSIAAVLKDWAAPVSIVVSSDMSHFVSNDVAKKLDAMALAHVEMLDPEGLFNTVRGKKISMCGMLPMTVGMAACRELGADKGELVAYSSSAEVSGDYSRVVGYAGALVPRP